MLTVVVEDLHHVKLQWLSQVLNPPLLFAQVHARNKPLAPDVDLEQVARRTPGLAGSSLKNLLNEAAIHAARTMKDIID